MSSIDDFPRDAELRLLRERVVELEQRLTQQDVHQQFGREEFRSVIRAIIESTPDAIFMKDLDGRYVIANSATAEIIGRPLEQIIGKTDAEMFPLDTAEHLGEHDTEVMTGRQPRVYEEVIPSGDLERTYHVTKTVCQSEDGEMMGTLAIARDITERKRAETALAEAHNELEQRVEERTQQLRKANEQLREDFEKLEQLGEQVRESRERFRVIAESMPVPIVISQITDGEILYANPQAVAAFAGPEESLVGQKSLVLLPNPEHREQLATQMSKDGRVNGFEVMATLSSGRSIWVSTWIRQIRFDDTLAFLAGFLDITNRKIAEDSLERERRLLRRLLDLHERDRQLTAYEIHDGMVQDLTAAVMFMEASAHQLSSANGNLESLEKARHLVQASIDEARRMINGLQPPILEDSGVISAIENLIAEIEAVADIVVEFQHAVQFDRIAPALEMAIYRTVQESLNNVWQHSGSRTASVSLMQQDQSLEISIRDQGIGFDATKEDTRCYGLRGIRERARLLGGTANITSGSDQGTQVLVTLPLDDVLLPKIEPDAAS